MRPSRVWSEAAANGASSSVASSTRSRYLSQPAGGDAGELLRLLEADQRQLEQVYERRVRDLGAEGGLGDEQVLVLDRPSEDAVWVPLRCHYLGSGGRPAELSLPGCLPGRTCAPVWAPGVAGEYLCPRASRSGYAAMTVYRPEAGPRT